MTRTVWDVVTWGDALLAERARGVVDLDQALCLATSLEPLAADLGTRSAPLVRALATLGSIDLSLARAVEPHLDATAILAQARREGVDRPEPLPAATWGVYAASPPGAHLQATEVGSGERWTLTGTKPWCSLGDVVSHALVTAADGEGAQRLFAVALEGVTFDSGSWRAKGLQGVRTGTLTFDGQEAHAVGGAGWYVDRPGFAWGGIGVAAVWFGGAAAVAGALWDAAARRPPDQIALQHIGTCDVLLSGAREALRAATRVMDDPDVEGAQAVVLAARVRAHVTSVAEQVLTIVGHALGPAPLALDVAHLTRVADLTLYLRQHHAERDLARLGSLVLEERLPGQRGGW